MRAPNAPTWSSALQARGSAVGPERVGEHKNLLAAQPADSTGAVDHLEPVAFRVEDRQFGTVADGIESLGLIERTEADHRFARDDNRRADLETVVTGHR